MSSRRVWVLAVVLAAGGGLVVVVAGLSPWSSGVTRRDVGGLAVPEPVAVAGAEVAPLLVPLGLCALLAAVLLGLVRGLARSFLGAAVGVLGIATAGVAGAAIVGVADAPGALTAAPFAALVGGVTVLAAGVLAARGPARPPPRTRYTVDAAEKAADDEWELADAEEADDGRRP